MGGGESMKIEEVVEFLKKQDLETITEIWMEILGEMRERWGKGKEAPPDIKELEEMFKTGSSVAVPGITGKITGSSKQKPKLIVSAPPIFGPFISTQNKFGFPPVEGDKLFKGKVYCKGKMVEGKVSCGIVGLTLIKKKKAVSIRYNDIDKIEWIIKEKNDAPKQNNQDRS